MRERRWGFFPFKRRPKEPILSFEEASRLRREQQREKLNALSQNDFLIATGDDQGDGELAHLRMRSLIQREMARWALLDEELKELPEEEVVFRRKIQDENDGVMIATYGINPNDSDEMTSLVRNTNALQSLLIDPQSVNKVGPFLDRLVSQQ